jgi:hypothetical protein
VRASPLSWADAQKKRLAETAQTNVQGFMRLIVNNRVISTNI